MNNKIFLVVLILVLLVGGVFAMSELFKVEKVRDIPKVLNPSFVKCVEENGKLDLIDRASSKYNPKALVDGSLSECEK